ncbi:hypothetical protein H257_14711 [Aphanomyces astaci]|uniref:Uncharacterized protein n=1 Tax=Aphanomyces astaci TaxID=112090 RepID=W4FSJ0_APHAT|nr:hypothetical protein H257_14711 [Aphanomyces astaci]ETV69578.1 hypothetical protein H257_14711 [Aphanomyces astaci]|eukprot:XP_009840905.1 hypothetical protein H257_14711 [Aphanomyces astaci]
MRGGEPAWPEGPSGAKVGVLKGVSEGIVRGCVPEMASPCGWRGGGKGRLKSLGLELQLGWDVTVALAGAVPVRGLCWPAHIPGRWSLRRVSAGCDEPWGADYSTYGLLLDKPRKIGECPAVV